MSDWNNDSLMMLMMTTLTMSTIDTVTSSTTDTKADLISSDEILWNKDDLAYIISGDRSIETQMDDNENNSNANNTNSNSSHNNNDNNLSATLDTIRALLNPENYPPSYRATVTRRTTVIIAFYFTIVIVSLFGNLSVCYVIFKRKRMRISTNLLMTNLALSDLLMTIINIPFNIARVLLDEWPFGSILCILVPLVQVTSVYVSTLTMTIIAIDRYQAIINPLHKRITTSLPTSVTILLIWIAAALFSIPNVAFNGVVEIAVGGDTNLHRCRAVYPRPDLIYRRYITLFTFLTQYAIPLSVTTFAYIRISFNIWSNLTETKNQNHDGSSGIPVPNNDSLENSGPSTLPYKVSTGYNNPICYKVSINQLRERSRRKSIKMLALVVGVFSICWLPLNIFHLNSDFSSNHIISDPNIFFACHWFAMSSVCYNPFIYFWLNRHYRQEIKNLVQCTNVLCSNNINHSSSSARGHIEANNENDKDSQHRNKNHHFVRKNHRMVCLNKMVYNDNEAKETPLQIHHGKTCRAEKTTSNCKIVFRTRFNTINHSIAKSVYSDPVNGPLNEPLSSSNSLIRSNISLYIDNTNNCNN